MSSLTDIRIRSLRAVISVFKVYVEDVDKLFERLKDKVMVVMKPKDQLYGIREFTIRDPFDFIWTFAQAVEKNN